MGYLQYTYDVYLNLKEKTETERIAKLQINIPKRSLWYYFLKVHQEYRFLEDPSDIKKKKTMKIMQLKSLWCF